MAETLEKLVVRLEAESARFQKGMADAEKRLKRFEKSTMSTGKALASFQRAIVGVGVAAAGFKLASLTKDAFDYADGIGEAAGALGLTTKAYQELQFAASQAGIKQDQFTASFAKFVQTAQDAASGKKGAADIFNKLGIDAAAAQGDVEKLFDEVVTSLDALPTQAERLSVIGDLFGAKVAAKWSATLSAGKQGLDDMRQSAQDLGLVLSDEAIATLGRLGDATDAVGVKFKIAFAEGLFEGVVGKTGELTGLLQDPATAKAVDDIAAAVRGIGDAAGTALKAAGDLYGFLSSNSFGARAAGVAAAAGAGGMAGFMVGGPVGAAVGAAGAGSFEALAIAATMDQNEAANRAYLRSGMSFAPGQGQSMIPDDAGMSMIPDDFVPKAEAAAAAIDKTTQAAASAAPAVREYGEAYDFAGETAQDAADWERELGYIYAQNEAAILGVTQEVLAYDQAIADLNLLLENGVISHQQYERAAAKAAESLDTYANAVHGFALNLREDVKQSTSGLFQNLITDGANWKDHLLDYFAQIGDAFARMAADMAAQMLFGTTGGGGGGIDWGALVGQIVGSVVGSAGGSVSAVGTRGTGGPVLLASGGPLSAGQPAIIGEEGPELVLPRHAMQVFSNEDSKAMLGRSVTQNFTIVAPDPNAFRGSERQITRRSRAALGIA